MSVHISANTRKREFILCLNLDAFILMHKSFLFNYEIKKNKKKVSYSRQTAGNKQDEFFIKEVKHI